MCRSSCARPGRWCLRRRRRIEAGRRRPEGGSRRAGEPESRKPEAGGRKPEGGRRRAGGRKTEGGGRTELRGGDSAAKKAVSRSVRLRSLGKKTWPKSGETLPRARVCPSRHTRDARRHWRAKPPDELSTDEEPYGFLWRLPRGRRAIIECCER
jgi:hypothetical protein